MSYQSDVLPRLFLQPDLPAQITAAQIEVVFHPPALATLDDDLDGLNDSLRDMTTLLRAGFLGMAEKALTLTATRVGADRVMIEYQGGPRHPNLLLALLRLVHACNQSPAGGFALLARSIGEDEARRVFADVQFAQMVSGVGLAAQGIGTAVFDPTTPAPFGGTGLPEHGLIEAREITVTGARKPTARQEDAFLSLMSLGCFHPDRDRAFDCPEPEIFTRASALILHDTEIEAPFLNAFLVMLADGACQASVTA